MRIVLGGKVFTEGGQNKGIFLMLMSLPMLTRTSVCFKSLESLDSIRITLESLLLGGSWVFHGFFMGFGVILGRDVTSLKARVVDIDRAI